MYQSINSFVCWFNDVDQMFVSMDFVLIMSIFVNVWRDKNSEMFFMSWQWDWIMNLCVSVFSCFNDFCCRSIDQFVIESFQVDMDMLVLYEIEF